MKKNKIIKKFAKLSVYTLLVALGTGCTDKFEEYNTNQYQIHEADPATLMKSMIETIVNIQQNDSQMMDQMVGQLGGYLCCSNTWSGTNFGTFNPSDAWSADLWKLFPNSGSNKFYRSLLCICLHDSCHYHVACSRLLWSSSL